jgi:hypothetical protein
LLNTPATPKALSGFNFSDVPVGSGNPLQTKRSKVCNAIRDQIELLKSPTYQKTSVVRRKG